jgi:hypothetical protein
VADEEHVGPSTLRVEVVNPQRIYTLLKNNSNFVNSSDDSSVVDEELSNTKLDGEIVKSEETSLALISQQKGNYEILVHSTVDLADGFKGEEAAGYFSREEVTQIQEILTKRGVSVKDRDIEDFNELELHLNDGVVIGLHLGYRSKEHRARKTREGLKSPNPMLKNINFKILNRDAAEGFPNEIISLDLFEEKDGQVVYPQLSNGEERTVKLLETYAKGYQHILEAIHTAKGARLPEKTITLASPIEVDTTLDTK